MPSAINARLSIALLLLVLPGCLVAPPPTATHEMITSYNTQLLTFYGVVVTGVVSVVIQLIGILMSRKSIKASNHQNEKLMELTQELQATKLQSNATVQHVVDTGIRVERLTDTALAREDRSAVRPQSPTGREIRAAEVKIDAAGATISIVDAPHKEQGTVDVDGKTTQSPTT